MKRVSIIILSLFLVAPYISAQNYAYVDTKYILKNIPSYNAAQKKLDDLSKEWQEKIEAKRNKVDSMYKKFQAEKVLLNDKMKKEREEEIIEMENKVQKLQKEYFGKEGKLYQKRQELIKPIQDEVYNAVKQLADKNNYAVVFDASSGPTMLYTDPKYDKSDEVLEILGYQH